MHGDNGETFESAYVFFTNRNQVLPYLKKRGREADMFIYKALEEGSWARVPAVYDPRSMETYMFTFNLPHAVSLLRFLMGLFGRIGKAHEKLDSRIDGTLEREYVFIFNHEHLHESMDRLVGSEYETFKSPTYSEVLMLNDLVDFLAKFDSYKGPFSEPRKIPKH